MVFWRRLLWSGACLLLFANAATTQANSELPLGKREVYLQSNDGSGAERLKIAEVEFTNEGEARAISVVMNDVVFHDHFLSMRPFKCLEGGKQYLCHVPYPYEIRNRVTVGDLTDLEYAFLFVHKKPNEYGINLWNGLYWLLSLEDGRLIGDLHEVDIESLGIPPDAGELRPIKEDMLHEAEKENFWLPYLIIE